jgi:hypothetical protein
VKACVERSLATWHGEQMPISRHWVEREVEGLNGADRAIARLALVLAKASYQLDPGLVTAVLGETRDEPRFIRILVWASFSAARRFAQIIAEKSGAYSADTKHAA